MDERGWLATFEWNDIPLQWFWHRMQDDVNDSTRDAYELLAHEFAFRTSISGTNTMGSRPRLIFLNDCLDPDDMLNHVEYV